MVGYAGLIKPPLSPSNLVYFIIWALLYVLMGFGAAIVCISENKHKNVALLFYAIQLVLNFAWANVFFSLNAMLIAFVLIMVLFASVTAMLAHFYRVSKTAGVMQLPYLFWVGFLAYFNLSIYLLNR
ncbi:MAG: tryptophan-rich sensory protein [Clostridiales bacterium]|nr:tryptophan-rich sensory protein [Clostridiales bacterium]